jgi:Fusaric acid resistance protein family
LRHGRYTAEAIANGGIRRLAARHEGPCRPACEGRLGHRPGISRQASRGSGRCWQEQVFASLRALFLVALALWCAACALVATLLHNFASYSAALAGFTAAIIAADELGATGGPNGDAVFLLAVYRASEICIGIVSAGIVLAGPI